MYDKNGKFIDNRAHLRIKLKSLAAEAKIIRFEERKHRDPAWRHQHELSMLRLHRITVVRNAARDTHIAYGIIRGLNYRDMEPTAKTSPNWKEVERMVRQYGGVQHRMWSFEEHRDELLKAA